MPKQRSKRKWIVTGIVLILLAALAVAGYLGWKEFTRLNQQNEVTIKETTNTDATVVSPCKKDEDAQATKGVFCSEEIGLWLSVPAVFNGKFQPAQKYAVYSGPLDPAQKITSGTANEVFSAQAAAAGGSAVMTIAKEPLRTGYVGLLDAGQEGYFDAATKEVTRVSTPTRTGAGGVVGKFAKGEPFPSFSANGLTVYQGLDRSQEANKETYLLVINDAIIVVSIAHTAAAGSGTSSTTKALFNEFEQSFRSLKEI